MTFISPIWLILLVPWIGLIVWLLSGRLEIQNVPFLKLWRAQTAQDRKPNPTRRTPPISIIALLAAMFFAIIAAARPVVPIRHAASSAQAPDINIDSFTIRSGPNTQAMIRLTNETNLRDATLTVLADGHLAFGDKIQLPPRNQSQNYFADIPVSAAKLEATVDFGDGNHRSILAVRRSAWPAVEALSPLTADLQRMIEVYSRHRPPSDASQRIAVDRSSDSQATSEPTAIVLDDVTAHQTITSPQPLVVMDSPLTQFVQWNDVLTYSNIAAPPGAGWQPLVSVGAVPVLATRQQPQRQVWVGFDSDSFPHRTDFVVFWTAVFDWLGNGAPVYDTSKPATQSDQSPAEMPKSVKSLANAALFLSLILICLSALTWKSTPFDLRSSVKS